MYKITQTQKFILAILVLVKKVAKRGVTGMKVVLRSYESALDAPVYHYYRHRSKVTFWSDRFHRKI